MTAAAKICDVDIVINTHIHYDHVGWNTMLVDGNWVPTFPNARYLIPARDYDYFNPAHRHQMRLPETEDQRRRADAMGLVFADSVAPIEASGQLRTWDREFDLSATLRLEPASGHTPGCSVLWLREGPGAVFAADLTHSPIQIARPDDACSLDVDPEEARRSRRRVFRQAAAKGAMVLPAHYPGHGGAVVGPSGSGFQPIKWAPFPRI